jgi:hypothetical protein
VAEDASHLAKKKHAPAQKLPLPKIVNLLTDLKEERDVGAKTTWVVEPMTKNRYRLSGKSEEISADQSRHARPVYSTGLKERQK